MPGPDPAPIRPVARDDVDALVALMEANGLLPGETLRALLDAFFAGGGREGERWLVDDAAGVRAVAMYAPEPLTDGTWNLLLIAVDPALQGRGVGAALTHAIEADVRAAGGRLLLVETSGLDDFARTRAFYERLAYRREAVIRSFYRAGDDKVVFVKTL